MQNLNTRNMDTVELFHVLRCKWHVKSFDIIRPFVADEVMFCATKSLCIFKGS